MVHSDPIPAQGRESPRILFIDDDPECRRAFARTIARSGFEVDVAHDLPRALELLADTRYHVIATDLMLSGINGMTVISQLGKVAPDASFVLVTGASRLDLPPLEDGQERICAIVQKPWDADTLLETLEQALCLHHDRRRRREVVLTGTASEILLVEDNRGDAVLVERLLDKAGLGGHAVVHKVRLGDALAYLKTNTPHAIITDLSLPDARGLDCVSALRVGAPDTPLLVSSSDEDEALAVQAVRLGAQDFVVKDELTPKVLGRALRYATERKRAELELRQLANYDELTGLANRRSFQRELTRALARTRRDGMQGAVLFCDLNGFKPINDRYGHAAGDQVLRLVGQRLSVATRESDFVARLGGDEFALLAEKVSTHADAEVVAGRIASALEPPMFVQGQCVNVGSSIGVALFPENGTTVEELLAAADSAMYAAKRSGSVRPKLASELPRETATTSV